MSKLYLLSEEAWTRFQLAVQKLDSLLGPGVVNTDRSLTIESHRETFEQPASNTRRHTRVVEIVSLHNDYLTVKTLDVSGTKIGDEFEVAKPYTLRHVVGNYDWPTTLTTTDTNTVEVTDGTDTYDWTVAPIYQVGDIVTVQRVAHSGVDVGDDDLKWLEVAPSRVWGAE